MGSEGCGMVSEGFDVGSEDGSKGAEDFGTY